MDIFYNVPGSHCQNDCTKGHLQCRAWAVCDYWDSTDTSCFPSHKICVFERNLYGRPLYCNNTNHIHYCKTHQCPHMFKCRDSFCIYLHNVCDGVQHCPNNEDELGCQLEYCITINSI